MIRLSQIESAYARIAEQLDALNRESRRLGEQSAQAQARQERERSQAQQRLQSFDAEWSATLERIREWEARCREARATTPAALDASTPVNEAAILRKLEELRRAPGGADQKIRAEQALGMCQRLREQLQSQRRQLEAGSRVLRIDRSGEADALEARYEQLLAGDELRQLLQTCQQYRRDQLAGRGDLHIWAFQERPFPAPEAHCRNLAWASDVLLRGEDGARRLLLPQLLPQLGYFLCSTRQGGERAASALLYYLRGRLQREQPGTRWSAVVQDAITLYDSSIGFLQSISGDCTCAYAAPACHDASEANAALDQLWALANSEPLSRVVLLRGFPGRIDAEKVARLADNAQRLRLSIFIIDESGSRDAPRFYLQSRAPVYREDSQGEFRLDGCALRLCSGKIAPLSAQEAARINAALRPRPEQANLRYPLPERLPERRSLRRDGFRLPFGRDENGREGDYDTHDNPREKGADGNAGFVVGVSGSGKSTLLHALIAGAVLNYHPDEVELWLADFKMKEFARYIRHRPPHVRYILLDESPDMVRSLIDKLTDEMKRRQRLIASTRGASWYQDVAGLPLLFVVIDEFSRMSQAIREDPDYRIKLQNLFTQARDQGIRFLLSSQFYAAGVESLSDQAKDQIGIRMAMRTNDKNEMRATLALPTRLTDSQDTMIRLLPNHMLLQREGSELGRYRVFYFTDEDSRKFDQLIDQMNRAMRPQPNERALAAFRARHPELRDSAYLDKLPLVVSGDPARLETFDERREDFQRELRREEGLDPALRRCLLWTGRPRRLEASSSIALYRRDDENLLLCANYQGDDEQRAGMQSIVRSIALSAALQGGRAEVFCAPGERYLGEEWRDLSSSNFAFYSEPAALLRRARQLEAEVRRGRDVGKPPLLLILIDPVSMLGSQNRKLLKQRLLGEAPDAGSPLASGDMDALSRDFDRLLGLNSAPAASAPAREAASAPKERTLAQILPYLVVAGSEQGVHVICVVPQLRELLRSGMLPDDGRGIEGRLSFFRHRMAFRMLEEDNDDFALHRASRSLLTQDLMNCYVYRDGRRIAVREPYRLP